MPHLVRTPDGIPDDEHPLVREARERAEGPIGVPWGALLVGLLAAGLVAAALAGAVGWLPRPVSYAVAGGCLLLLPVVVFVRAAREVNAIPPEHVALIAEALRFEAQIEAGSRSRPVAEGGGGL